MKIRSNTSYQSLVRPFDSATFIVPADSFFLVTAEQPELPEGIEAGSEVANLAQGDKVQSTQSAVVLENLISRFLYNKASDAGSAPAGN